jgi:hypothetical protein
MEKSWARTLLSGEMPAVLVGVTALIVWWRTGILDSPIFADRAYFTYLSQAILRGEPIYASSFMGYPPLGLMLQALSMWIGEWFNLPTYLAPRFLAVLVGGASAMLLSTVTRRATGNPWAGVVAGIVLASFLPLSDSALITLEPKQLVIFFTLLASAALQTRRWRTASAAAALAASCWQPALLVPVAVAAVLLWNSRQALQVTLGKLCSGTLVGALPVVAYLTLTGQWWDFWQRSVVLPANWHRGSEGPLHWLQVAGAQYRSDVFFFWLAGIGLCWFAIGVLRKGSQGLLDTLHFRMGGLPLLTIAWILFNTLEFQNSPDMLPILPCVAYWVGGLVSHLTSLAVRPVRSQPFQAGVRNTILLTLLLVTAWYGFADGARKELSITLDEQVAAVRDIVESAGSDGTVISFSAEAVYALSERPAPLRFLRLTDAFLPFLHLAGFKDCRELLQHVLTERPAVVVLRVLERPSECEERIPSRLSGAGYSYRILQLGNWRWSVFVDPRQARN